MTRRFRVDLLGKVALSKKNRTEVEFEHVTAKISILEAEGLEWAYYSESATVAISWMCLS